MYVCIVQINMDTFVCAYIMHIIMHAYVSTCACILESNEERSNENSVALILDKACRYFSILKGIMGMWATWFQWISHDLDHWLLYFCHIFSFNPVNVQHSWVAVLKCLWCSLSVCLIRQSCPNAIVHVVNYNCIDWLIDWLYVLYMHFMEVGTEVYF